MNFDDEFEIFREVTKPCITSCAYIGLLIEIITYNEVDKIISAEIPSVQIDSGLHDIIIKSAIHGPCQSLALQ